MPAQSVHQTRTLAHQPLPATVQQHGSLLVSRLDRHKAHRRALNRLANRFRIGGIVLVALDVRLHVLRRHQSHLVAKRAQLPRPVVRRRARLQANQTGRQSTEERQNLRTPKLLAQNRPSLCNDAVHLKNMLRQVQSDRSNLAHGWLPFAADSITAVWHSDAARGPSTPSFDYLIDATEDRDWEGEAEPLGGLEVDDQLDFGDLLDRQVGGFLALENAARVEATQAKHVAEVGSIAHEASRGSEFGILVDRRNPVAECQCGELFDSAGEECVGNNDESAGAQLDQGRESRIDLPFRARIQNVELQPKPARRYLQLLGLGLAKLWALWVDEQGDSNCCRDNLVQHLKPLRPYLRS